MVQADGITSGCKIPCFCNIMKAKGGRGGGRKREREKEREREREREGEREREKEISSFGLSYVSGFAEHLERQYCHKT
jgi:hypothetical protein